MLERHSSAQSMQVSHVHARPLHTSPDRKTLANPRMAGVGPDPHQRVSGGCAPGLAYSVPTPRRPITDRPEERCYRAATTAPTSPSSTAPTRSAMRRRLRLSADRTRVAKAM